MNTLVVFSALCIGLVAGGASHAAHRGRDNIGSSSAQREYVDVPYTVEYRTGGGGSHQNSGGNSYGRSYQQQQPSYQQSSGAHSYGRGYQYQQPSRSYQSSSGQSSYGRTYQQPQFDVQRAELTYQNSYSQSPAQPQTQTRQYVDVPYTVEERTIPARSFPQPEVQTAPIVQQRTYSAPQQQTIRAQPRQQQLVDVPYTVEVKQVQRAPAVQQQRSYSPPVQQRTYSPPAASVQTQSVSRQAKQYVDVPYTVQTTRTSNSNVDSGLRYLPYSAGSSLQVQAPPQQQHISGGQYVDVPYQVLGGAASGSSANNFRFLPYSLGNSLPITTLGGGISSGYANPLAQTVLPIYK